MATLDLRPQKVDVRVHPGNTATIEATYDSALGARTFTWTAGALSGNGVVAGSTVTVTLTEAQTATLTGPTAWKLTETTGGGTEDILVGHLFPSEHGAPGTSTLTEVSLTSGGYNALDARLDAVEANGWVTTPRLADGAVTAAKVAADVATQAELDAAISGLSATYVTRVNARVEDRISVGRDFVGAGMAVFEGTISNVGNADGMVVTTKTVASTSGFWDIYGISSQNTDQRIDAGVIDTGRRVGVTGDAYNASALFAGTLAYQIGLRGRAGFAGAAGAGARTVQQAIGGYFEIRNEAAGTTITDAYGVFVNNSDTSGGTITNRYDLYASSANAKSYFAGTVGIGTNNPQTKLHIAAGTSSAADLEAVRLQNGGENGTIIRFENAFGPVVSLIGGKLGAGASADEGQFTIRTAVNSVLYDRMRVSNDGVHLAINDAGTVQFAITNLGLPRWSVAASAQTTVGAAGAASALPLAPTKYLKVVDSTGTTLVIPAYNA